MTVSIEVLAEAHLRCPALRLLLEGIPPPFLPGAEAGGGLARAVLCNGEDGRVSRLHPEREAMVAIQPDWQGQGIATAALALAKGIAVNGKAMDWISAMARAGRAAGCWRNPAPWRLIAAAKSSCIVPFASMPDDSSRSRFAAGHDAHAGFRLDGFRGVDSMKHLVTLAFLLAAAGFYVAGMSTGMVAFAGAGVLAEGAFWFRLKAKTGK